MKTLLIFSALLLTLLLCITCNPAFAANTIGKDTEFSIRVPQVLKAKAELAESQEYVEASVALFNYFFWIQVFFGLYACFLRLVFRVLRM